eukprot:TRINITY_DN572_c0_g1_i4.p1 TRINITY_DN572_c0_g1~~TRINITY_DN572_c0_g1_i4.p1  ORF type:complete len:720 (+),score=227.52 TRINITY_DN572_c0_g1_i4:1966-4125(+)
MSTLEPRVHVDVSTKRSGEMHIDVDVGKAPVPVTPLAQVGTSSATPSSAIATPITPAPTRRSGRNKGSSGRSVPRPTPIPDRLQKSSSDLDASSSSSTTTTTSSNSNHNHVGVVEPPLTPSTPIATSSSTSSRLFSPSTPPDVHLLLDKLDEVDTFDYNTKLEDKQILKELNQRLREVLAQRKAQLKEIRAKDEGIKVLERTLASANGKVDELERQRDLNAQRMKEMQKSITNLQAELDDLRALQLEAKDARIQELENELNELQREKDQVDGAYHAVQQELRMSKETQDTLEGEIADLRDRVSDLEAQLDSDGSEVQQLKNRLNDEMEKVRDLKDNVSQLEDDQEKSRERIKKLKEKNAGLSELAREQDEQIKTADENIADLKGKLADAAKDKKDRDDRLAKASRVNRRLTERLNYSENELAALRERVGVLLEKRSRDSITLEQELEEYEGLVSAEEKDLDMPYTNGNKRIRRETSAESTTSTSSSDHSNNNGKKRKTPGRTRESIASSSSSSSSSYKHRSAGLSSAPATPNFPLEDFPELPEDFAPRSSSSSSAASEPRVIVDEVNPEEGYIKLRNVSTEPVLMEGWTIQLISTDGVVVEEFKFGGEGGPLNPRSAIWLKSGTQAPPTLEPGEVAVGSVGPGRGKRTSKGKKNVFKGYGQTLSIRVLDGDGVQVWPSLDTLSDISEDGGSDGSSTGSDHGSDSEFTEDEQQGNKCVIM